MFVFPVCFDQSENQARYMWWRNCNEPESNLAMLGACFQWRNWRGAGGQIPPGSSDVGPFL